MGNEAVATGKATENIFSGFRFASVKRTVDERDRWTDMELTVLSGSPVWAACLPAGRRSQAGAHIIRGAKFWIRQAAPAKFALLPMRPTQSRYHW